MNRFFIALSLLANVSSSRADCETVVAAFDIGSAATKLKVAKVNTCEQRVIEYYRVTNQKDPDMAVAYKADLNEHPSSGFSEKIKSEGIRAVGQLMSIARSFGAQTFIGVATEAFREAPNGEEHIETIAKTFGIKIKVITQTQEAKLGFVAASYGSSANMKDLIAWDIGGASQQIIGIKPPLDFEIYQGKFASVPAKELVLKLQGREKEKSPNPIDSATAKKAIEIISNQAFQDIPEFIKGRIQSGALVVGIGGVHAKSVLIQARIQKPQAWKTRVRFNQRLIEKTLEQQLGKSDSAFAAQWADTEVTNLILVLGYMKGLQIKEVEVAEVNLADALLIGGWALLEKVCRADF